MLWPTVNGAVGLPANVSVAVVPVPLADSVVRTTEETDLNDSIVIFVPTVRPVAKVTEPAASVYSEVLSSNPFWYTRH